MTNLNRRSCRPCEGGVQPLGKSEAAALAQQTPGWHLNESATEIEQTFGFANFYETMAFVNALAWIAHREDHHPDIEVRYKHCRVRYSTHTLRGLSENDFICAAKLNDLVGK